MGQIETSGACDCNNSAQDKVGVSRTGRMDDQVEADLRSIYSDRKEERKKKRIPDRKSVV